MCHDMFRVSELRSVCVQHLDVRHPSFALRVPHSLSFRSFILFLAKHCFVWATIQFRFMGKIAFITTQANFMF